MKEEDIGKALDLHRQRDEKDVRDAIDIVLSSLEDNGTIKAHFHRMCLSGDPEFEAVQSTFGALFCETKPKVKLPNYRKKLIKQIGPFKVKIYAEPKSNFMPSYYLDFACPDSVDIPELKAFLEYLHENLPGLQVSKLEYALDVFIQDRRLLRYFFD